MSRRRSSTAGQSAVVAALGVAVVLAAAAGGLGLGAVFAERAALQAAADAAALAAAGTAAVQVTVRVRLHELACAATPDGGSACRTGPVAERVLTGPLPELSGPRLRAAAGCDASGPAAAGSWTVCDEARVTAYAYVFPSAATAAAAARAALAANAGLLPGATVDMTALRLAADGSGRVSVTVAARVPAGPLALVTARPTLTLQASAAARPRRSGP
jgi:hypothetical protein